MTENLEARDGVMRLSHRLVAMHIAGVCILILVVLSSVLWVSAEHNKLALESSESLVRGGVGSFRARLRTLVNDYSVWDEAYTAVEADDREWLYSNIGNAAAAIGTLDMIAFVPVDGRASFGWRTGSPIEGIPEPLPQDIVGELTEMLANSDRDAGGSDTMFAEFEGDPWAFSIARVHPVDDRRAGIDPSSYPLQIHGQRLSEARVAGISRNLLVEGMHLSSMPEAGEADIALRDVHGEIIRYIAWPPPRPGASILRLVALPLGLALLLIAGVSAISSAYAVRSARRLERALYDAKAADRSKTEFLSNVSHELRTPMNGILGVAQLLQTTRLDEEQRELVDVLFSSATAQMALISDLLDISRMETGNRRLVIEPFAPAAILRDVTEMMRVAVEKKQIGLDSDWSTLGGLTVRSDARGLRQILTNLLGNAIKFTDRGRVTLTALVTRAEGRTSLVVRVADTGRGIPAEALPHIFERFYQVDGSLTRGVEGTGLGLAISQNLARMMGGRIEVASELGQGSTFELILDLEVVEEDGEARDAA
jgi:signal transduction histidine kinase